MQTTIDRAPLARNIPWSAWVWTPSHVLNITSNALSPETTDLNFCKHAGRAQAMILFVLARLEIQNPHTQRPPPRRTCRLGRIGYLDSMFFLDRRSTTGVDGFGAWAIRHILSLRLIAGERQRETETEREEERERSERTGRRRPTMRDAGWASLAAETADWPCRWRSTVWHVHVVVVRTECIAHQRHAVAGWLAGWPTTSNACEAAGTSSQARAKKKKKLHDASGREGSLLALCVCVCLCLSLSPWSLLGLCASLH